MRKPSRLEIGGIFTGLTIAGGIAIGGIAEAAINGRGDRFKEMARNSLNRTFGNEAAKLADNAYRASVLQEARGITHVDSQGNKNVSIYKQVKSNGKVYFLRADMPVEAGNAQPDKATMVTVAEAKDVTAKPDVRYTLTESADTDDWTGTVTLNGTSAPISPWDVSSQDTLGRVLDGAQTLVSAMEKDSKILFPPEK